jgi:hypothetical protein
MTLVEVAIVMAILSMLVGITFGAIYSLKGQGANVYCITALKDIGSALREYRLDYAAYPPAGRAEEFGYYNPDTGEVRHWNDPPPDIHGWAPPSAYQGPPVAYYPLNNYPHDEHFPLPLLKYGGAIQTLVQQRLLNRGAVCRNDLTQLGSVPNGYSTYLPLYNYWGYDQGYKLDTNGKPYPTFPNGKPYPLLTGNDANGNPIFDTTAPLESRGDPLPPGIPTWELYPRLANPNAPDTTIVTRCPNHSSRGRGRSNVLRLGGDVITVWDDEWLAPDDEWLAPDGVTIIYRDPYQYQPERPGNP